MKQQEFYTLIGTGGQRRKLTPNKDYCILCKDYHQQGHHTRKDLKDKNNL